MEKGKAYKEKERLKMCKLHITLKGYNLAFPVWPEYSFKMGIMTELGGTIVPHAVIV